MRYTVNLETKVGSYESCNSTFTVSANNRVDLFRKIEKISEHIAGNFSSVNIFANPSYEENVKPYEEKLDD